MITMPNLGINGRLGNQLFQYAALRAASLRNNLNFVLPLLDNSVWHGQKCLLVNLPNIVYSPLTKPFEKIDWKYINEDHNEYRTFTNKLHNLNQNYNYSINGFFQNILYFEDYKKNIIHELKPTKIIKNDHASLHFRLGDMIDGTNPEYEKFHGLRLLDENTVVGKYYRKAINKIQEIEPNIVFDIFVGGSRTDGNKDNLFIKKMISYDESLFNNKPNFMSSDDAMDDFINIISCKHHIVSFASTFSWWAAYLDDHKESVIIAPKNFLYDNNIIMPPGYFPNNWIQL